MSSRMDMLKRYNAIASASAKAPGPAKKHHFEILLEKRNTEI